MTPLERRYRHWMITYPAEHRAEHESEILGTLLDTAAPGQEWPGRRECVALVVGGLRTRARLAAQSPARLWADGLRWAAIMALILASSSLTSLSANEVIHPGHLGKPGLINLEAAVAAVGAAALVRARLLIGLSSVLGIVAIQLAYAQLLPPPTLLTVLPAGWPLVAGGLGALAWVRSLRSVSHASPWPLTLISIAAIALLALYRLGLWDYVWLPSPLPQLVRVLRPDMLVLAAILLLWAVVAIDPRPALAVTVYLAVAVVDQVQLLASAWSSLSFPWTEVELWTLITLLVATAALVVTISTARYTQPTAQQGLDIGVR
jgi:hypothetical protein